MSTAERGQAQASQFAKSPDARLSCRESVRSSRRMYVSQRGSLEKHQSLRGKQVPSMWASCCRDFFALSVDVSQAFCEYFLSECKVQGEINHPRSLRRIIRDGGGKQALSCIASIRQPSRRDFQAGDWQSVSSAVEQWRWERLKASSEQAFWRERKGRVEDYVGRKTVGMGPRRLAGGSIGSEAYLDYGSCYLLPRTKSTSLCTGLRQWQWFSMCGPHTSIISLTWEPVRSSASQALTYWIRNSRGGAQ